VEGHDFLLDLEGDTVSDGDLKAMIVESVNLAKALRSISHTDFQDWFAHSSDVLAQIVLQVALENLK
jgi:hypothetical protein